MRNNNEIWDNIRFVIAILVIVSICYLFVKGVDGVLDTIFR